MCGATAFFAPAQRALFAAIPVVFLAVFVAKVLTGGISASTASTKKKWMTIVFDLIPDLVPRDEAPVNAELDLQLLLILVPLLGGESFQISAGAIPGGGPPQVFLGLVLEAILDFAEGACNGLDP